MTDRIDPNSVRLLGSRVLVRRFARKVVTEGGIHLPDKSKMVSDRGEVVAIGPEVTWEVSEGDVVVWPRGKARTYLNGEARASESGEDFLIFEEEDLLAVVD